MSPFEIGAVLIGLSALFGWVNNRFLKMPHTIGLVIFALAASLALILVEAAVPLTQIDSLVSGFLAEIDFHEVLMHGMLGFVLFAGAMQIESSSMRGRWRSIGLLASVGTVISVLVIGTLTWWLASFAGQPIPFVWALVFGALISPTDPVAVLELTKVVRVPAQLKTILEGESLFNDGVGLVLFTVLVGMASHGGGLDFVAMGELFVVEVFGGMALGLAAGSAASGVMRGLEHPNLGVLITLALVMLTYSAAIRLDISGPIAIVVAGMVLGGGGREMAMDESSRQYLRSFWRLVDAVMNSVLFLLIGLEVLTLARGGFDYRMMWIAIPAAIAGRWLSVLPIAGLSRWEAFDRGAVPVLTWGGLRGGIAVALALSLPHNEYRSHILHITYAAVLFSIVVQGLTIKRLIERVVPAESAKP